MAQAVVPLTVLLCTAPLLALSQLPPDLAEVRGHQWPGGYMPRVGLRPLTASNLDELLNVLARSMEARRLPSGRTVLLSRLAAPTLEVEDNPICNSHTKIFWQAVGKELWADRLFDATGKLPDGILAGNIHALGAWDECVNTEVALDHKEHPDLPDYALNFTGRYVSAMFSPNFQTPSDIEEPSAETGEDGPLGGFIVLPKAGVSTGVYGICVPSSCSTENARAGMQKYLGSNVTVLAVESHVKDEAMHLTSSDKLVISMMAIVGILMAAGTLLDLYNRGCLQQLREEASIKSNSDIMLVGSVTPRTEGQGGSPTVGHRFRLPSLEAFSVYTNTIRLLDTSHGKDNISCLHGIRFLTMTWVVMGHAASFSAYFDGNTVLAYDLAKTYLFAAIDNATVSVDTFFLLSGALVAYGFFKTYERTKRLNIGMMYLHRYIRLSVPYMFAIAITATWLSHIGNGPLWTIMSQGQSQYCQKYWWRNLLYVQNLVDDKNGMCLGQSWYLANDMQMFMFAPLVLLPFVWRPLIGAAWLVTLTVAFLALRLAIWSAKDLPPTAAVFNPKGQEAMMKQYIYPWMRCTVWLTGIGLGYLLHRLRGKTISLKPWLVWPAWLAAAATAILVVYGMTGYQMPWQVPSKAVSVTYGGLNRFAWGLAISWVIFACHTGYGGWVNTFLSYGGFIPLSRLTYVGYLIHINAIMFYVYSSKGVIYYDNLRLVYFILSQMIVTFVVSFVFSISFEIPFAALEKLWLLPARSSEAVRDVKDSRIDGADSLGTDSNIPPSSGQYKKL